MYLLTGPQKIRFGKCMQNYIVRIGNACDSSEDTLLRLLH